jgi:hypothetical protein
MNIVTVEDLKSLYERVEFLEAEMALVKAELKVDEKQREREAKAEKEIRDKSLEILEHIKSRMTQ